MAISRKLLNPGEDIVVDTRTHPKVLIVPVLTLVAVVALGTLFQVLAPESLTDSTVAVAIVCGLVAVLAIWRFGWPVLVWLSGSYTFTSQRLITRHGVITRRGHDIPLSRISDVASERDLLDRVLGCGTLLISAASEYGQIKLYDIPRVEDTQRRLNQLLHDLHRGETRSAEGL